MTTLDREFVIKTRCKLNVVCLFIEPYQCNKCAMIGTLKPMYIF